jgi:type I restriction enzyme, S subunit
MKRWPTKPLGELVDFIGGGTPRRDRPDYWGGEIPWASVKDLQSHSLETTLENITAKGLASSASNLIPKGTVIIASRVGLGKVAINLKPVAINQDLKALTPRSRDLSTRYLLLFLLSKAEYFERAGVGATVKGLTLADYQKLDIAVPPLAEQERIVKLLDEADELRKFRAQADRRTASLIPSLFHEMFGSPAINPFGWPVECVGTLFDVKRGGAKCGPFGSALKKHEYIESGIPVWGIPNILPNQFVEAGSLFISPSKFEELRAYAVEPDDLLFSRAGTVGRICVARPKAKNSIIGTNLIRVAFDRKRIVSEFFATLMTHLGTEVGRLRANADAGSYSFMNTTVLKRLRIYLPPLQLQNKFAARMSEIRALQAEQATSRRRLNDLFQSMLYRAFQGEL